MTELVEPISVDRVQLIQRLNESLGERKAKDAAEAAKATDTLAGLVQNLSNYERRALAAYIRSKRENKVWDTDPTDREATGFRSDPDNDPAAKVNPYESYERLVRTLEMGTDASVSVSPDDDVYPLI